MMLIVRVQFVKDSQCIRVDSLSLFTKINRFNLVRFQGTPHIFYGFPHLFFKRFLVMHNPDKTHTLDIAIAEDHSLVREAFKQYINLYPDLKVVLEVSDGSKLLKALNQKRINIDVLLLDLYNAEMDGRETLKSISVHHPSIKVLIVSACDDQKIINDLFESGAYGFISKMSDPAELYDAIIAVSNRKIYKNKFYQMNKNVVLNASEMKLLELIWEEKTNEEISDIMCLSTSAIEKIRHQLKRKTNAKTTVGLMKYALDRRIITPDKFELK